MSFSEREINTIHANTSFINGEKYFGKFDRIVTAKPTTERLIGNQDLATEAMIFIPVMERAEKLETFLHLLKKSIDQSQRSLSFVILDNSIERKLWQQIKDIDFGSSVIEIFYHHDPRMTQSGGRNKAYANFSFGARVVGIWDSDIYASLNTISNLLSTLDSNPELSGIAPPLGRFGGGTPEVALSIYKNLESNKNARTKLHMPGKIGEENGIWKDKVLRTAMMRGSFFVRRGLIESAATENPSGTPWLEDFVLWQNVPFFISARENNFDFGYLMRQDTVVLHDDRIDKLSVGYGLKYRAIETLKSIFILMYRNNVFTPNGKEINSRFLEYNIPAIRRVTGLSPKDAAVIQEEMLKVVHVFNEADKVTDFKFEAPAKYVKELKFIELLKYELVFSRIKKIRSKTPLRPIYTI